MATSIGIEREVFLPSATREPRTRTYFPIERELRFRLTDKHSATLGSGTTVDIGSKRVLFRTAQAPPSGKRIEMAISWPVQLDHRCALKLLAKGRVMRAESGVVAVSIEHYEFRTLGSHGLEF